MPQKEPPGTGTWGVSTNVCIECIGQTAKFACSNRTRKVSAWLIQTSQSVRSNLHSTLCVFLDGPLGRLLLRLGEVAFWS